MTWPLVRLETLVPEDAPIMYGILQPGPEVASGIPYVRPTEIRDGRIVMHEIRRTSPAIAERYRRATLASDDVLLSIVGTIGKVALVPPTLGGGNITQSTVRIRARPGMAEPRYLYWVLQTPAVLRQFDERRLGTGVPRLNVAHVRELQVPRPAIEEQRRIADILDKADAIRRKRKEAIALTEELLRSAFLELFGDPVTNSKGWPVKPLGDVLALPLRNGLSPASGGKFFARVLTLAAITGKQFNPSAQKQGAFAVEPWNDVRVDERDFLICRGNGNKEFVGRGAFPPNSDNATVFPDTMIAARVDTNVLSPAFLTTCWNSGFIRQQLEAGARTTNGTFKINQTVVEGVRIVLPPRATQARFDQIANQTRDATAHLQRGVAESEQLFDAVAAQAFAGAL